MRRLSLTLLVFVLVLPLAAAAQTRTTLDAAGMLAAIRDAGLTRLGRA
jgi:hypothetical protein